MSRFENLRELCIILLDVHFLFDFEIFIGIIFFGPVFLFTIPTICITLARSRPIPRTEFEWDHELSVAYTAGGFCGFPLVYMNVQNQEFSVSLLLLSSLYLSLADGNIYWNFIVCFAATCGFQI